MLMNPPEYCPNHPDRKATIYIGFTDTEPEWLCGECAAVKLGKLAASHPEIGHKYHWCYRDQGKHAKSDYSHVLMLEDEMPDGRWKVKCLGCGLTTVLENHELADLEVLVMPGIFRIGFPDRVEQIFPKDVNP